LTIVWTRIVPSASSLTFVNGRKTEKSSLGVVVAGVVI
jgi:hypothetical protein